MELLGTDACSSEMPDREMLDPEGNCREGQQKRQALSLALRQLQD